MRKVLGKTESGYDIVARCDKVETVYIETIVGDRGEDYYITSHEDGRVTCTCAHFVFHQTTPDFTCKHIMGYVNLLVI